MVSFVIISWICWRLSGCARSTMVVLWSRSLIDIKFSYSNINRARYWLFRYLMCSCGVLWSRLVKVGGSVSVFSIILRSSKVVMDVVRCWFGSGSGK